MQNLTYTELQWIIQLCNGRIYTELDYIADLGDDHPFSGVVRANINLLENLRLKMQRVMVVNDKRIGVIK